MTVLGEANGHGCLREEVTPPEPARHWGIEPQKVLTSIRSSELRAINVGTQQLGRPGYLIDSRKVEAFEQRRAVQERATITRGTE